MSIEKLDRSKQGFETLDPENWDAMRALAHRMVDDTFEYTKTVADRKVWQQVPEAIVKTFDEPAPATPSAPETVYAEFLEKVMPYPMGNIHPRFWGWYMGNGTVMGALADYLAATVNSNLGGGNHVANMVEGQVVNWMKDVIGFPRSSSGLLTSGGSMANVLALTVARNARCGFDVRTHGLHDAPRLGVYASVEVHSCNQKGVEMLGMGSESLRKVAVNDDYTIDLAALKRAIEEDERHGVKPIAVIASAGTINTGAIDDMNALADLCEQRDMWLHIDGAIGAIAMLSDRARPRLTGIERADSVALDLHKWMHMPFEAGCVIVKHEQAHRETFSLTPEYLSHQTRGLAAGRTWFSDYGPQLSRGFKALKIWMSVKEHGMARFGRMIDRNIEQAEQLAQDIASHAELRLTAPVGLDIVCFRFDPGDMSADAVDDINREILALLHERGIAVPSYTTLGGRYCLRVAISNHRSRPSDFDALLEAVVRLGREQLDRT